MKNKIQTVEDAFVFHLQQLFYSEKRISDGLFTETLPAKSLKLKREIKEYADSSGSKLLKLERIFNYLMTEPYARRNELVNAILCETTEVLKYAASHQLKDILILSSFKNISAVKLSCYRNAYIYSVELELDTPADLLQEIIDWEVTSSKTVAKLAVEEFNHLVSAETS
jgi:ferritin-like metal-binding protein YciE